MPFFQPAGCQLYYEDYGQGEPLLLVHGLGSSSRDWEFQIPVLAARYRVIALDLRGHGRSDKPAGPYSIAGFAADALALLDHLQLPRVHLVGISMGGMVGFQLAVDQPQRLLSLCVINSSPDVRLDSLRNLREIAKRWLFSRLFSLEKTADVLAGRLFPKPEQQALRDKLLERWPQNDKRAYLASLDAIIGWSVRERLASIDCPTLILSGDADYAPLTQKEAYVRLIPQARLQVIADSGHASPLDQPDHCNALLLHFLDNLPQKDH